ncbi:MAG: YqeG family HAD IIIA-type phosphatase [Oscillospiraceae bacterium]|jgi:HAD superfamily phosphatase (TIGR01668 family)|nr:YqeG family HAD IIIA-type phosphatase [Oscillospiraceae bacterium]
MSFSPFPKYKFHTLLRITPEFLRGIGVSLLLLDLDNTIAPYRTAEPTGETIEWARAMKNAGITLFIVSNSRKSNRVAAFAAALGIEYVYHARKPSPRKLAEVAETLKTACKNAALAGDQIFTDTLAANRAGVVSLLVRPIKFENPLHALRYIAEQPIRIWRKTL